MRGIVLTALVALSALAFAEVLPLGAAGLAVILGLVVARGRLPETFAPGVGWSAKHALTFSVVLLGFTVDVRSLAEGRLFLAAATAIVVALVAAEIGGRLVGASTGMRRLLGVGTGICGISAMAAAKNIVDGDEDLAQAATVVTVLGSIGLLALPLAATSMDAATYGAWAGATLHAVPHAVGAGAAAGIIGTQTATIVKLTRVALLGPVLLGLAGVLHKRGGRVRLPLEVTGFLGLLVVANIMPWPAGIVDAIGLLARLLLVFALAALGLQTQWRGGSKRAWLVGVTTWAAVLAVTLWIL